MISRRDFTQIIGLAAAGATVAGYAEDGKYSHRVLDGIGHNMPQEAPRQFADAIIEVAGSDVGTFTGEQTMSAQNSPVTVVDAGPGRVSRSVEVAAPASELFAIVADPRRHHELDGSGTVVDNIRAPAELATGSKFSTKMRMLGVPYRITSTVTAFTPDALIEWRHPLGHRWRWEFEQLDPQRTRVTETFDYHAAGTVKGLLKYYELMGFVKANAKGIEATLVKLRDRYAKAQ